MENALTCAFCDQLASTKDHIPPKNLFKTSPPKDLITVPACLSCNHDASRDDEWFRNYLVSDERIRNHPEARELNSALERSLKRPQSIGLQEFMDKNFKRFPLMTESGLYYGEGTALTSDFIRESKVLTRFMKGLYYHELKKQHPIENVNSVFSANKAFSPDLKVREERSKVILDLVKGLKNEPKRTIGNDVFSYKWGVATDNPDATFWALVFFNTIPFSIISIPRQQEKLSTH